ncbi:MAG: ferrous iron transport protein [Chloroflexota bacterium]|nr:ferrous iron transport protein [Chloroflexota bacterium]
MVVRQIREECFQIDYGDVLEKEIIRLEEAVEEAGEVIVDHSHRWLAIKLLENDAEIIEKFQENEAGRAVLEAQQKSYAYLNDRFGEDVDTLFADKRYGWIHALVKEAVKQEKVEEISTSDKIDKVVTNRYLGIPIFMAMMWIVFKVTTDIAGPFMDWVDMVISGPLTNWIVGILGWLGLGGTWVESLFIDGIVAGVGGVMVFVPVMLALYFSLALLEDSGYMARAAFVMDRFMHSLGLHGKSFLCMIVGFGCTVPACYATRTLENEKDRILTGLLVPFMSCGARLPVYVLFASVFFPHNSNTVVFLLYLTGILVAVLLGFILSRTLFKREGSTPFVLELPPYRMPTAKNIWFHMWERTSSFVKKAFSIIMITSVVLWFTMMIPVNGEGSFADTDISSSGFAAVSEVIAPALEPAGFGSWQASGSLITGFVAKEVIVSSMAQIFEVEEEAEEAAGSTTFLQDAGDIVVGFFNATVDTIKSVPLIVGINLFGDEAEEDLPQLNVAVANHFEDVSGGHGALASVAFMVFVLLYTPCMVAVAAQRQEFGNKWALFSMVMQLGVAWIAAVAIFQGGLLLGLG